MTCPSIAGWLNIAAVTLNGLGVLTLFYFRPLGIGGFQTRASVQATVAQNLSRLPKQHAGAGLIGLGWLAQVIAVNSSPELPLNVRLRGTFTRVLPDWRDGRVRFRWTGGEDCVGTLVFAWPKIE
jgi:hypothetical protein